MDWCLPRTEPLTEHYVCVNINTKIYKYFYLRARRELLFSNATYASPPLLPRASVSPAVTDAPDQGNGFSRHSAPLFTEAGRPWD